MEIGRGTFSRVFKGHVLGRTEGFAYKVHTTDDNDELSWACVRDISIARVIQDSPPHSNVLQYTTQWVNESIPHMVMSLASGTLDVCARRDVRSLETLYAEMMSGARHLHALGVIHRDIKPNNVLVFDGGIKLADFGSAIVLTGRTQRFHIGMTTAPYAAPEMLSPDTKGYDHAVDIWSIGVVVSEACLNRSLFRYDDVDTQLARLDTDLVAVKEAVAQTTSAWLDALDTDHWRRRRLSSGRYHRFRCLEGETYDELETLLEYRGADKTHRSVARGVMTMYVGILKKRTDEMALVAAAVMSVVCKSLDVRCVSFEEAIDVLGLEADEPTCRRARQYERDVLRHVHVLEWMAV